MTEEMKNLYFEAIQHIKEAAKLIAQINVAKCDEKINEVNQ